MEVILSTRKDGFKVMTVYLSETKEFAIVFEYTDGSIKQVDNFKAVNLIIELHNYWCAYTGIIDTPFASCQVKKHLTTASLRVG